MKPTKTNQRRQALADNTDDLNRIDRTLSATYLLITMAEYQLEDAERILSKYGLVAFDLKHQINTMSRTFDKIDATFRKLIESKTMVNKYCDDLSKLQDIVNKFINK